MRNYFILSLMLLGSTAASAQDLFRYGSYYSAFGPGDLIDYRSSYAEGMGVTGIAAFNVTSPGTANPAFLGGIALTTSGSNAQFRSFAVSSNGGSQINTQLQINSFQLLLPLIKNKFGMAVSLLPLTERSYKVERVGLRSSNDPTVQFDLTEAGEGTLNRLEMGLGYAISPSIYVGYSAGMVFGSINRQSTMEFYSSTLVNAEQNYINAHRGFSNRFGLAVRMLKSKDKGYRMVAGGIVELPVNLSITRTVDDYYLAGVSSGGGYTRRTSTLAAADAKLPASVGFGATFSASNALIFTGEMLNQSWSGFSYPDNSDGVAFKNRTRTGFGAQLSPASRLSRAKWRMLKYRAGVVFDTGNTAINGERISTFSVTGGISVPSPLSGSTIDINGSFGRRGTTSAGLVSENVFALRIALNLSEFMFFKRYIQ